MIDNKLTTSVDTTQTSRNNENCLISVIIDVQKTALNKTQGLTNTINRQYCEWHVNLKQIIEKWDSGKSM